MGYPVMLKASKGGGGRGMRWSTPNHLAAALESAQREANSAFGSDEVFVEKLVRQPAPGSATVGR